MKTNANRSVFTKIIDGELPCFKIFEDAHIICFLTIEPIQLGHALVVPKIQVDHFSNVPEPFYSRVFEFAKEVSPAIHRATGCVRVGAMIVGLEVPHFHLHLVPLYDSTDLDFKKAKKRSAEEQTGMLEKIRSELHRTHAHAHTHAQAHGGE